MKEKGMKWNNAYTYTISLFLLLTFGILIFNLDFAIMNFLRDYFRSPLMTSIMLGVTYFSSLIIVVGSLLIIYAYNRGKTVHAAISLLATMVVGYALKVGIGRFRPFQLGFFIESPPVNLIKQAYATWDFGFPSTHAATVLAVLMFLPNKVKPYWIAFSVLVIFSRIYFGFHYLSDVLAGASLGLLVALLVNRYYNPKAKKKK